MRRKSLRELKHQLPLKFIARNHTSQETKSEEEKEPITTYEPFKYIPPSALSLDSKGSSFPSLGSGAGPSFFGCSAEPDFGYFPPREK